MFGQAAESVCNRNCRGNESIKCGGTSGNSVYAIVSSQRVFHFKELELNSTDGTACEVIVAPPLLSTQVAFVSPYRAEKLNAWAWVLPSSTAFSVEFRELESVIVVELPQSRRSEGSTDYSVLVDGNNCTVILVTDTHIEGKCPGLAAGPHVVTIHKAGPGLVGSEQSFITPLTVTSVSPSSGSYGGGQIITVNGSGFSSGTRFMENDITVCGQQCKIQSASSTSLTCMTPSMVSNDPSAIDFAASVSSSADDGFFFCTQSVEHTAQSLEHAVSQCRGTGLGAPVFTSGTLLLGSAGEGSSYLSMTRFVEVPVQGWTKETNLYQTPDFKQIVEEVTSHPGWTSGKAITFVFSHVSGNGDRSAFSYDYYKTGAAAPRLKLQAIPRAGGSFLSLATSATEVCNLDAQIRTEHAPNETCAPAEVINVAPKGAMRVQDSVSVVCQPAHVSISSGGRYDGNYASISVNGKSMLNCSAGINMVVLDGSTRALKHAATFDTSYMHAASTKMTDFLSDEVVDGDIVVLAVMGDGQRRMDAAGVQALESLGLSSEPSWRESIAFIATKGDLSSAQEERDSRGKSINKLGTHLNAALGCEFSYAYSAGASNDESYQLLVQENRQAVDIKHEGCNEPWERC